MDKFSNFYIEKKDKQNRDCLYSKGIYKTSIKEADLPDYFVKLFLAYKTQYISLKGIKDICYRPSYFTNHYRKDDSLYISYDKQLVDSGHGYKDGYDVVIWGLPIDIFIEKYEKFVDVFGYDRTILDSIKESMDKKTKWFKYWDKRNWDGNYSFTSSEEWKEILTEHEESPKQMTIGIKHI